MKLPKKYTVQECLHALDGLMTEAEKYYTKRDEIRAARATPVYTKSWFGLYRKSMPFYDALIDVAFEFSPKPNIGKMQQAHAALSKYPIDELVQLTVEETNELFGETK